MVRMMVFCRFQKEKLHRWPGAVEHKEVSYLANLHRHMFHFQVKLEVSHDDREIEFIMLKHEMEKLVDGWGEEVGSCEMMASSIARYLRERYPGRQFEIEVSEDGENGAVLES